MRDFEHVLSSLVVRIEGAIAAAVGGLDGLLVEGFTRRKTVDLAAAVAEHAGLLRSSREAYAGSLGASRVRELCVWADQLVGYARLIDEEYFLLLLLEPDANLGKTRVVSSQAVGALKEVLG